MKRIAVILSAAALLIILASPPCLSDAAHNAERLTMIESYSGYSDDCIALVGDSITECFPVPERYHHDVLNCGVGGAGIIFWNDHIDVVLAKNPKIVIVMIGINDTRTGRIMKSWEADYDRLITRISESGATPVLVTISPVGRGTKRINPNFIIKYNRFIRDYARANRYPLIDANKLLSDEWYFMEDRFTTDGVHFTDEGYAVLLRAYELIIFDTELNLSPVSPAGSPLNQRR